MGEGRDSNEIANSLARSMVQGCLFAYKCIGLISAATATPGIALFPCNLARIGPQNYRFAGYFSPRAIVKSLREERPLGDAKANRE